jgi:HEPN domain-containing protein
LKAEGDYHSAEREFRARTNPNYDSACFHCQQCVEKYFKAFLQEHSVYFPRTHSLTLLLAMCAEVEDSFDSLRNAIEVLEKYSVDIRYPGEFATKEETRAALGAMKQARTFSRAALRIKLI